MNEVTACRSVLIEVLTILAERPRQSGPWLEDGWPQLTFPDKGDWLHYVDVPLTPRNSDPRHTNPSERNGGCGLSASADMPFRFFRSIRAQPSK